VLVALDDALLEFEQVNLPGTFFEYPNWRRKNSAGLERIASDGRIAAIAAEVRERVKGASP
jgi:4-alpha-glucanotransferase